MASELVRLLRDVEVAQATLDRVIAYLHRTIGPPRPPSPDAARLERDRAKNRAPRRPR